MGGQATGYSGRVEFRGCHIGDGSFDTELELRFGSPIELLVYGGVVTIKRDVGPCAIGKSLERNVLSWQHVEQGTELPMH